MYRLLSILLFAFGLAVTTDEIYDNSHALLIGIDKYQNVGSLDYAVKDAEDIKSVLIDKFHFQQDNIVLLKNEEATKAKIIQEFSNITKIASKNDRVLIFFAGHGRTKDLPDGGEMGYLLPVDAYDDLYVSAIPMEEIKTISLLSKAKHILYLVDACYSGIASIGTRNSGNIIWGEYDYETTQDYFQKTTQTDFLQKKTENKSRHIITAGGRGEEVIEKAEWGNSAFTKNLLSGLRDSKADIDKDGIITVQELGAYLMKRVPLDSNNKQTPKIRNLSTDEGEFIFVLSKETNTTQINTAQTKDNSRDERLELLESKIEKLESQQSSNTSIKKQNNNIDNDRKIEPYWQKEYGAGFFATPTMTTLEFYNIINNHWEYSLQYEHSRDKISSSLYNSTQSNQMHQAQLSVIYSHVLSANPTKEIVLIEKIERYRLLLGGGLGYAQVMWTDSALDFNYFKISFIGGVGVKFIKIKKPLSTQIGCKLLFELSNQPHLDENGKAIFDKNIDIKPKIIFLISFPQ